jgi:copper(I)-binding protein
VIAGCDTAEEWIDATDIIFNRPLAGVSMSVGYLTLTNHSSDEVQLTSAESPQFRAVEFHETRIDDGIVRMVRLESLQIAGGGSIHLEAGGKHLMFVGSRGDIREITVRFYSGDEEVLAVTAPTQAGAP